MPCPKPTGYPFHLIFSIPDCPLFYIHHNVAGSMPVVSTGGSWYLVSFIGETTRFNYIYAIKHKSQVFSCLVKYLHRTDHFHGKKIRILKLDQVGEYLSNDFNKYLSEKGVIFERAPPKTFWQNSMPEHLNSSLLEWATSVMIDAGLQKHLWDEIVMSMSLIIKMSPSPKLDMKILYSLYIASLFNSNTWIWSSQEQLH